MQMLKFGRLVDLAKLETVSVNRTVEELKEKLRQEEMISAREIAKWDVSTRASSVQCFSKKNHVNMNAHSSKLREYVPVLGYLSISSIKSPFYKKCNKPPV